MTGPVRVASFIIAGPQASGGQVQKA